MMNLELLFFCVIVGALNRVLLNAAPLPSVVIINNDTRECVTDFWPGDEFVYCYIPRGWQVVAATYTGATCPDGFTEISRYNLQNAYCLSVYCSGMPPLFGFCDAVVVNDELEQCAISRCEELPPDWKRVNQTSFPPPCPYEDSSWQDEIDCEDPCLGFASCDLCVDAGCSWSNGTCGAGCATYRCIHLSEDQRKTLSSSQVCRDINEYYADLDACTSVEDCENCVVQPLPSNSSETCQWIKRCNSDSPYCETCDSSRREACTTADNKCEEIMNCSNR